MLPTQDHDLIRSWGTRVQAVPAEVLPAVFDGEPTQLHFLFGKAAGGTPQLHPISWEEFFARFDLLNLSLAFESDGIRFQIVRVEENNKSGFDHH